MKMIVMLFGSLFLCSAAYAQNKKSLVDIDKELKQAKSSATVAALVESISDTTPQTADDVAALGQLIDRYPAEGQKALAKINDPALARAVMMECSRQVEKVKSVRAKNKHAISAADRLMYHNSYRNSAAAIGVLANINNKEAIPFLRAYLKDADFARFASVALGRLEDTESLDAMVDNIEQYRGVDLSGYGDKGLVRIVDEINKPGTAPKRSYALIGQIKGSKSPERKRLLKELALNHPNAGVRDQSGQALINSMIVNREVADNPFIAEWIKRTKNTDSGYWAVSSISISHEYGERPLEEELAKSLIDVLKTSTEWVNRQEAARALGIFRVKEALPALVECSQKDSDTSTRGDCRQSYWKMTGEILPSMFNPKDVVDLNLYFSSQEYIRARAAGKDSFGGAVEIAFQKYKELHR